MEALYILYVTNLTHVWKKKKNTDTWHVCELYLLSSTYLFFNPITLIFCFSVYDFFTKLKLYSYLSYLCYLRFWPKDFEKYGVVYKLSNSRDTFDM